MVPTMTGQFLPVDQPSTINHQPSVDSACGTCYDPLAMLLQNKTAIVFGVANKWSAAWHMAQAFHREGARIILTYQGERLEKNVRELAPEIQAAVVGPCDVRKPEEIQAVYQFVEREV